MARWKYKSPDAEAMGPPGSAGAGWPKEAKYWRTLIKKTIGLLTIVSGTNSMSATAHVQWLICGVLWRM
jgi:hypothetical protein